MGVNVYQIVTDRIIAELENGIIPWEKPWTGVRSGAYSRATGRPYSTPATLKKVYQHTMQDKEKEVTSTINSQMSSLFSGA